MPLANTAVGKAIARTKTKTRHNAKNVFIPLSFLYYYYFYLLRIIISTFSGLRPGSLKKLSFYARCPVIFPR